MQKLLSIQTSLNLKINCLKLENKTRPMKNDNLVRSKRSVPFTGKLHSLTLIKISIERGKFYRKLIRRRIEN